MRKKYLALAMCIVLFVPVLTGCSLAVKGGRKAGSAQQTEKESDKKEESEVAEKLKKVQEEIKEAQRKKLEEEKARAIELERVKIRNEYDLYLRSFADYYLGPDYQSVDVVTLKYKIADLTNDGMEDLVVFFDNGTMADMYSRLLTYDKERGEVKVMMEGTIGTEYYPSGVHFEWPNHQQDPSNPQSGTIYTLDESGNYQGEYTNYDDFQSRYKEKIEGQIPVTFENALELTRIETQIPKEYAVTEQNPVTAEISGAELESSPDYPRLGRLLSMFDSVGSYASIYDMTPNMVSRMTASAQYLRYDIPMEMEDLSEVYMNKSDIVTFVKKVYATDISTRPEFASWNGADGFRMGVPEGKAAVAFRFNAGVPGRMAVVNRLSTLKNGTYYVEGTVYSYDRFDYSNRSIDMFEPKESDLKEMGLSPIRSIRGQLEMVDGSYTVRWIQSY